MSAPDWVIVNANHGGRLDCLRCGEHHLPSFPISISLIVALGAQFAKDHAGCKEKPEGLHCVYCNAVGHRPMECPTLEAATPGEWVRGRGTCPSSRTIFHVIERDSSAGPGSTPRYHGDFTRCRRLLRLFGWRKLLPKVVEAYRGTPTGATWERLVAHWDELEALWGEEAASGAFPKLGARLKELHGQPE